MGMELSCASLVHCVCMSVWVCACMHVCVYIGVHVYNYKWIYILWEQPGVVVKVWGFHICILGWSSVYMYRIIVLVVYNFQIIANS